MSILPIVTRAICSNAPWQRQLLEMARLKLRPKLKELECLTCSCAGWRGGARRCGCGSGSGSGSSSNRVS
ncbi:hypothetical protein M5D96_009425 [Drosophila gunungcola]|uniref:Uncharacterized protein n=1 Tax=Drosophila gunungcola TaxID=103775 RepID=A0A9Q0BNG8_9MUSC|nr:hypothetical protein M5D96_009425 [Drosophila gunungcola]